MLWKIHHDTVIWKNKLCYICICKFCRSIGFCAKRFMGSVINRFTCQCILASILGKSHEAVTLKENLHIKRRECALLPQPTLCWHVLEMTSNRYSELHFTFIYTKICVVDFHVISIIDCASNYSQSHVAVFCSVLLKWYNKSYLTGFDSCILAGDFFFFYYRKMFYICSKQIEALKLNYKCDMFSYRLETGDITYCGTQHYSISILSGLSCPCTQLHFLLMFKFHLIFLKD